MDAQCAADTLLRAEEIRADKPLMKKAVALLNKKKAAIESIQDIKNRLNDISEPVEDDGSDEVPEEKEEAKVSVTINLGSANNMTEDQMVEEQEAASVEKGLESFKMAKNKARGA